MSVKTDPLFVKSIQPGLSEDGRWVCLTVGGDLQGDIDLLIPLPAVRAALYALSRMGADLAHPALRRQALPETENEWPVQGYLVSADRGDVTMTLDFGDAVRQVAASFSPMMACTLADKLLEVAAHASASPSTFDA